MMHLTVFKRFAVIVLATACMTAYGNRRMAMWELLFSSTISTSRLPAEYQEVQYLQSTGTQYIDTGVLLNLATTSVAIDCMSLAANNRMWGVTETVESTTRRVSEYFTSAGLAYVSANPGVVLSHSISNRAVVVISGGTITLDGVSKGLYTQDDIQFSRTFRLFGELQGVAPGTMAFGTSREWSAKLRQSSALVRDYVPCVRTADSVAGMYDLVNGTFATNQGTGSFIAGPNVGGEMDGLTPIPAVAWYKLDGNALDSSGNGYHGTWAGTESYTNGHSTGVVAGHFDGLSSIALGNISIINSSVTIMAWIKPSAKNKEFLTVKSAFYRYSETSIIRIYRNSGSSAYNVTGFNLPLNEYNHVAISLHPEEGAIGYQNGKIVGTSAETQDLAGTSSFIAKSQYSTYSGGLSDIRIYNCVLSEANIARIMTGQNVQPIEELQ